MNYQPSTFDMLLNNDPFYFWTALFFAVLVLSIAVAISYFGNENFDSETWFNIIVFGVGGAIMWPFALIVILFIGLLSVCILSLYGVANLIAPAMKNLNQKRLTR